uniref:sodium channel regulatory subunit beta-2-like isoform X2 n=1 Tax=Pristiophorus japonicus TaxID=55135 RepID=UPI00398EEF01
MKSRFLPLLLYLEVHLRCKRSKNNEGFELTCLARTGRRSIYLCRDKKADSLTLTVPQEVTGLLRKSVTIPCTYSPSALHFEVEVIWSFNTHSTIIRRDKAGDHIPLFGNRDRISIQRGPGSGDVSLTLKNLAYSDRGIYTCEVRWLSNHGLSQTKKNADASLRVVRALPSTRSPTSLSPVVIPTSGFNDVKIPIWAFVLTVLLIVLFFSVIIICIVLRTRIKTGHIYESPSRASIIFPNADVKLIGLQFSGHVLSHILNLVSGMYVSHIRHQ